MRSKFRCKVIGVGNYLPDKVLTNEDLEAMVDTSDEWITKRVGIKERRVAAKDEFTSDLATKAAERAIKDAGLTPQDIDLIMVATVSADMYTPSCACLVQKNLGAENAAAFDLNAACTGFVYATTIASQFIETGMYKTVLAIGADTLTKITEYKDRATCVLFGDGAGAVVYQVTEEDCGVLSNVLKADGTAGGCLSCPGLRCDEEEQERRPFGNPRTLWMDGGAVFKFAVRVMEAAVREACEIAGCNVEDLALVVPHQANKRIIDGARKRLGLTEEKVFSNVEKYGNMSAACVPIAFSEAVQQNRLKRGDLVALVSMGGGLTWGATIIKY